VNIWQATSVLFGSQLIGIAACNMVPTPKQQGAIVDSTCTVLEAFASSPTEEAICATADHLVALEALVRSARADAGPAPLTGKSGKCQIVASVCATDPELATAIRSLRSIK
jgi:hypothetical protein